MAHHEPTQSASSMNRMWREREREMERERERTISKMRQEASLKRVSAAVEKKSGNESRGVSSATAQSDRHRALPQTRESASQQQQAPRTTMSKLFGSRTDQSIVHSRNPSLIGFDSEYSRRSEPSLLKTDAMLTMDKHQEMEATEMRFRRSLPSTGARTTQDLAFALQSALQTDTSSNTSSSGSSASSGSSQVSYVNRSSGPTLTTVSELHPSRATDVGRPLERARSADVVNKGGEPVDDMTRLRQQVTLLMRTLEEEKNRRAMEQKLMQQKILELQGLIRHNMPEQKKELERNLRAASSASTTAQVPATPQAPTGALRALRTNKQIQKAQEISPYKTMKLLSELQPERTDGGENTDGEHDVDGEDEDDDDDDDDDHDAHENDDNNHKEDHNNNTRRSNDDASRSDTDTKIKMRQQLTRLRAKMRSLVTEAQQEAQALKKCLDDERRASDRKERQLRMEASLRVTSLEERYAYAKKKLLAKTSLLTTQVTMLTEQKENLELELQQKNERIKQLELAVGGRRIVEASTTF